MQREKTKIWQGNKKKHTSKNFLIKFLINKFKKDILNILSQLQSNKIEKILDIGCGEGFLTSLISKKFPHAKITAIDFEGEYIEYAKKFNNLENINYQIQDFNSFNSLNKFDLIIASEFLEHIVDFNKTLGKIKQLSNRFLIITVPNEPFFRIGNLLAFKYIKRFGNTPGHLHNWSKKQLFKILTELNFNFKIKTTTFWNIVIIEV